MNHTAHSNAETHAITTYTERTYDALSLENKIALLLWKVCPPFLLLLGSFGNVATIFVMRRIKDKNSSQHIFLMALAVSDVASLYVGMFNQWLYFLFGVDLYNVHVVICKISEWLVYAFSNISSWLLTCVTVQRTMAVKWPHKMRMMCSLRRTWTVVAVVVTVACALHCHFLWGMVTSDDNTCVYMSAWYEDFVTIAWTWVDLAVFSLVPSLCLLICNGILSSTLFKATSSASMTMSTATNSAASDVNASRRRTASRTTIMILVLSGTFLALTMPVSVYFIWDYYSFTGTTEDTGVWIRLTLDYTLFHLLWYTNSAVNFLLYCFTGTKFRGEFLSWIRCDVQAHPDPSVSK